MPKTHPTSFAWTLQRRALLPFLFSVLFLLLASTSAHAAVFTVNSANDVNDGTCNVTHCSLREAIAAANAAAGADRVEFNIPGSGPHIITVGADLPSLLGDITIDGYTQPGSAENTRVDGALDTVLRIEVRATAPNTLSVGFRVEGPRTTIRGLAINTFVVSIYVDNPATTDVTMAGNFLGTDAAGLNGNGSAYGIAISWCPRITVGGTLAADRNLISGNSHFGISLSRRDAQPLMLTVRGNLIGTQRDGTTALGNGTGIGFDYLGHTSPDDRITIGGSDTGAGNQIARNAVGISLGTTQSTAAGSVFAIEGNFFGTDATRTFAIGNTDRSIAFDGPIGATISNNVIAHGLGTGISILGPLTTDGRGVTMRGNAIYGHSLLGIDLGGDGRTLNDADDSDTGANALLNFPVLTSVTQDPMSHVSAIALTFRSAPNASYRVELFTLGVSNRPPGSDATQSVFETTVLTDANGVGTFTGHAVLPDVAPGHSLVATLTSDAGYTSEISDATIVGSAGPVFQISVELANGGPGVQYVPVALTGAESRHAVTDASGGALFFDLTPGGSYTVTPEGLGYTFAPASVTRAGFTVSDTLTFVATPVPVTYTVNVTHDQGDGACTLDECTLREAIQAANVHPGAETIQFAIPGAGVQTLVVDAPLPAITGALTIDGYTQPGARPNTWSTGGLDSVLTIAINPGAAPGANAHGLLIAGDHVIIRGLAIDGFEYGITIASGSGPGQQVAIEGNYLGTSPDGLSAGLPSVNGIGVTGQGSTQITIGGSTPAARNLISGNADAGIASAALAAPNVLTLTVQGNLIGTDATGWQPIPNQTGISHELRHASADIVRIGGDAEGEGNIIAATLSGIFFARSNAADLPDSSHVIAGNFIGLAEDGTTTLGPVGAGLRFCGNLQATARRNTIGGAIVGVWTCNEPMRVRLSENRFRFITNWAIDLGANGRTLNDADDGDTGPNDLQNYPVVSTVEERVEGVRIAGSLTSVPLQTYRIELFATGGPGLKRRDANQFLAGVDVTTDAQGLATFDTTVVLPSPLALDEFVVASATNTTRGVTSELSESVALAPLARYAITGRLTMNDVPLPGVAVQLSGGRAMTVQSDANGIYAIANVPATGAYAVTPADARYRFIPLAATFANLTANETADFAAVPALTTRYFAEGAAGPFWETRIAILNPMPAATTADVTFLLPDGRTEQVTVPIAGPGHAVVDPASIAALNGATFSARVQSVEPIVATRTMRWGTARERGAHAEQAVSEPRTAWFFGEGATGCFDLFYQLANPGAIAAEVDATFVRRAPQTPIVRHYTIAPFARFTIFANDEEGLGFAEVSARLNVTNNQPIVAERAMYSNCFGANWRGGHDAAGSPAPATTWRLAEGATGSFFDLYLLLANFETQAATVEVEYMLPDGSRLTKPYEIPAGSRVTIDVAGEAPQLTSTTVAITVSSTNGVPIVAERSQWWPHGGWYEGHASAGVTDAGIEWHAAGAEVGGPHGVNSYLLIANTGSAPGLVQVTAIFADGSTAALPQPVSIKARSRATLDLADTFPQAKDRPFGLIVKSLGTPAAPTPAPIVVELSTYNDTDEAGGARFWGAGTNIVATRIR